MSDVKAQTVVPVGTILERLRKELAVSTAPTLESILDIDARSDGDQELDSDAPTPTA